MLRKSKSRPLGFFVLTSCAPSPKPPAAALATARELGSHFAEDPRLVSFSSENLACQRFLIGICGVPGSGKTTVARLVADELARVAPHLHPAIVSMDGWHYPRAVLDTFSDPAEAHRRRGAPFTFNSHAFASTLRELKTVPRTPVSVPTFDHAQKDPVVGGDAVPTEAGAIIVEGNYLCLKDHPDWSNDVESLLDDIVFLDVNIDKAMERVYSRHRSALGLSHDVAMGRLQSNDRPNALLVAESANHVSLRIACD